MLLPDLGVIRFRSVADAVTAIRIDDTYRQTGKPVPGVLCVPGSSRPGPGSQRSYE
jgi:hypothetical protein